jgi:hypothetical protein
MVAKSEQGSRYGCGTAAHGTAPLPDDRSANMQRVAGVARDHLRNAAWGSFDHPSIKTSINPVDNPVGMR